MTCFVTLIGNAGSDCELKTTQNKTPFARFSIASNNGKDSTDWYSVIAFGDLVSQAQKVTKGSRVTVTGKLVTSEGKEGKTYLNVRASDISCYQKPQTQQQQQIGYDATQEQDDVPF